MQLTKWRCSCAHWIVITVHYSDVFDDREARTVPPSICCHLFYFVWTSFRSRSQVPCTCRISWILRILMGQSILFAQASSQLYIAWIYVQCSCCCLLKLELYLRSTMRRPSQTNLQCIGENVYVHTMYTFEIGGKRKPWRRHVGEFIEK